jgi:hemin uptake protein HemP
LKLFWFFWDWPAVALARNHWCYFNPVHPRNIDTESQQMAPWQQHCPAPQGGKMAKDEKDRKEQLDGGQQATPIVINAETLFRGEREVVIEHAGVRYRLRITRRNKLILQK